ncbi:MAG: MarR family transcriptional regulator [Acidobacteriaceae bacterium]|jgi:DNA-binding MarR family transcriptional regulator
MIGSKRPPIPQTNLLQALAEFRSQLRSFLQFSEQVARKQHLQPRQHQLLLQIAGISEGRSATINFLAERLGLRQNSVVELANRSVAEGLVRRDEDPCDRRRVVLSVTQKGMRVLNALSASHARELDEYGPQLIRTLERIKIVRSKKEHIPVIGRTRTTRKPVGPRSRGGV